MSNTHEPINEPSLSDAELIELGRQLEELLPEFNAVHDAFNEKAWLGHDLACERVGLTDADERPTPAQAQAHYEGLTRAFVDTGANLLEGKYNALCKQTDALARKIMDAPVCSSAGLRAKAMAAIHTNRHLWDKPLRDLDWDKEGARMLIEAVCSVTGLEKPVEELDDDESRTCAPSSRRLN